VDTRSDEDQLDLDVLDAIAGLIAELLTRGERVAQAFQVPAFFIKALHMLDGPLAMKDLGRRMHCDPSFVTGIADMLEKRGLAARESDPDDRRVKRLVLTPAGEELKQQVEQAVLAHMPWRTALSTDERHCLLSLTRKMAPLSSTPEDCTYREEEMSKFLGAAAQAN
jgi:DNA-binding MarR family transcriptional regulator